MDETSRTGRPYLRLVHPRPMRRRSLPREELEALLDALDEHLQKARCDGTHAFTRAWLERAGRDVARVCAWLESTGGFCDCEVAINTRRHRDRRR
jgi:hypothetical protein